MANPLLPHFCSPLPCAQAVSLKPPADLSPIIALLPKTAYVEYGRVRHQQGGQSAAGGIHSYDCSVPTMPTFLLIPLEPIVQWVSLPRSTAGTHAACLSLTRVPPL